MRPNSTLNRGNGVMINLYDPMKKSGERNKNSLMIRTDSSDSKLILS